MASLKRGLGIHFLNLTGMNKLYKDFPELVDAIENFLNQYFTATAWADAEEVLCESNCDTKYSYGFFYENKFVELPATESSVIHFQDRYVVIHIQEKSTIPVNKDQAIVRHEPKRCCKMIEGSGKITGTTEIHFSVTITADVGIEVGGLLEVDCKVEPRFVDAKILGGPCNPEECKDEDMMITADIFIQGSITFTPIGTIPQAMLRLLTDGKLSYAINDSERAVFLVRCSGTADTQPSDF